jgi:predicted aminopeptidase
VLSLPKHQDAKTMKNAFKILWNLLLWALLCFCSIFHETTVYLFHQSVGQISILVNTQSIEKYELENALTQKQKQSLELIESIKKYSVDSLSYKPTKNFTTIYNQNDKPILWVISASSKYKIEPFYWKFPVVGSVSYKGFFNKQKAIAAKNKLICEGYDVDLRSVSAWSTLGWFSDPVLSNMLKKSKGQLCNLIFHELFHATYYAESSVDYNENLASFIAHKATQQFLRTDSVELRNYLESYNDNKIIDLHISGQLKNLNRFYDSISNFSDQQKGILKLQKLSQISSSLNKLPLANAARVKPIQNNILEFKNAWFVDFGQYNSLQDSLEGVFNKIYQSNLAKMVQSLK